MKYRIVREEGWYYVETKGLLWGWNRVQGEIGWGFSANRQFGSVEAAEEFINEDSRPIEYHVVKEITK